jgi:endoglucanase
MRCTGAWLVCLLWWWTCTTAHAACLSWPLWHSFKTHYLSSDGRVVDASTDARITTSEGQAYAMLFALAANDRSAFDNVLQWTENNLAQGNLREHLPAWQWGHDKDNQWRALDANAASDADVWMAYALSEAGRLWRDDRYTALSNSLSERILSQESAYVPNLGLALLPGSQGFVANNTWRFNASYLPIQALRVLAREHNALWQQIITSSLRIIHASAPRGYATDWVGYRAEPGFVVDPVHGQAGSYDAIRVYLWAGMLHPRDAAFSELNALLSPALAQFTTQTRPAEQVNAGTTELRGVGPAGFSAAFLPLLEHAHAEAALSAQRELSRNSLTDDQHYFSDVLSLFGLGWQDGWLRFAKSGQLQVKWSRACAAS